MNSYIDAHIHLIDKEFKEDLDVVITEAKKRGVKHCLVVAENYNEFNDILNLNKLYPSFCLPCLGVHPCQGEAGNPRCINEQDVDQALPFIELHHQQIYAIGEVGLDFRLKYSSDSSMKDQQRRCLKTWVYMGVVRNVHSRSAGRPTLEILYKEDAKKVLMHAFDGKPSLAIEASKRGYYFSIPPIIVRDSQMKKMVELLPLDSLILETDSPALAHEKGIRNVPANIEMACSEIAKIKDLTIKEVSETLWNNTLELFPKIKELYKEFQD